jgi:hypothetical protein
MAEDGAELEGMLCGESIRAQQKNAPLPVRIKSAT